MKRKSKGIISQKICLKVKFERQKRNLSQEQLALAAGLNKGTIGKIERAEVSPTIDTLERISEVFEMDFLDFIDVSKVLI